MLIFLCFAFEHQYYSLWSLIQINLHSHDPQETQLPSNSILCYHLLNTIFCLLNTWVYNLQLLYTSDLDIICRYSSLTSFSIILLHLTYTTPDRHTFTVCLLNSPTCRYLNSMRSLLFINYYSIFSRV